MSRVMIEIKPLLFIGVIGLFLMSCGSGDNAKKAEKYGEIFYKYLRAHDYKSIEGLLDEEALKATPVAMWNKVLSDKEEYGEIENVEKKIGYSSSVSNGNVTISLNYKVDYTQLDFHEKIWFVKRGDTYKIWRYEYNQDPNNLSAN